MKPRITQGIDLWRAALILLFAAPLAEADADELNLEDIRPAWSVGQKWIVEHTTPSCSARGARRSCHIQDLPSHEMEVSCGGCRSP